MIKEEKEEGKSYLIKGISLKRQIRCRISRHVVARALAAFQVL